MSRDLRSKPKAKDTIPLAINALVIGGIIASSAGALEGPRPGHVTQEEREFS